MGAAGAGRDVSVKSYAIHELVAHADDGTFVIPPFQRDVVWEQDRMISLWDSMYRFYPVGTLLYWKTPEKLDMTRAVGGAPLSPERLNERHDAFRYILDGQQRLTAIYAAMKGGVGRIEGKETINYTLYFDATADLESAGDTSASDWDSLDIEDDVFTGKEDKPAKSPYFLFESAVKARRKKLAGAGLPEDLVVRVADPHATSLDHLLALKSHGKVPEAAIARLTQLARLLNAYRIPVTRVSGVGVADVCGIYMRINRFGRRLDPADVIMGANFGAGATGPASFNMRLRFNEIREELARLNPRWRRYESFRLFQMIAMCVRESLQRQNNANYKKFGIEAGQLLNLRPHFIQPLWPDIQSAIVQTLKFFIAEGIFDPERIPAAYLPMPLCAYLFQRDDPGERPMRLLRQWFWRTAFDSDAMGAQSDIFRARDRFFAPLSAGRTPTIAPLTIKKADLFSDQVITSTFSKALLGFLSHRGPRDFKTGGFVTFDPVRPEMNVYNDPTIHHICPKGFLTKLRRSAKGQETWSAEMYHENALLNLSLLPGATNRDIRHKSPVVYFHDYEGEPDFPALLDSHLIPYEFAVSHHFPLDGYPAFLEARLALFKPALEKLMPDVMVRWE